MQQAGNRTHWRANFLDAMKALAQAGARLPLGVPDPVLYGASAIELYTGGLWPATDLEVLAAEARLLTAELFAVGFRWSERPRHTARGLWHPELEIGIDIIEAGAAPSVAERSNRLIVAIDLVRSGPADVVSLKVVGIEDLLVQQAGCWLVDRSPPGEAATRLQVLLGVGREGVGGPLRTGYLQRRLARETNGEVVVETQGSEGEGEHLRTQRTTSLAEMGARISAWRDCHGLPSDLPFSENRGRSRGRSAGLIGNRNGEPGRAGRRDRASATILPFDRAVSEPPG
jgi:hypothetical protein